MNPNFSPSIGTSRETIAAATGTAPEPLAGGPAFSAAVDVDVETLLMTFAIGGRTPGVRAKASMARDAFARLVVEASGAVATLEALGGDASGLRAAIEAVCGPARP